MPRNMSGRSEELFYKEISIDNQFYMEISIHRLYGDRKINKVIHTHPRLELSMVKSGTGRYYIGDKGYTMEAGDIFIINNVEPHGIEMNQNDKMVNMVIHF